LTSAGTILNFTISNRAPRPPNRAPLPQQGSARPAAAREPSAPTEACLALLGEARRAGKAGQAATKQADGAHAMRHCELRQRDPPLRRGRRSRNSCTRRTARGRRGQLFDVVPGRTPGVVGLEPSGQRRHRARIARVTAGRGGVSAERGRAEGRGDVVAAQPPAHLVQCRSRCSLACAGRGEEEEHENGGGVSGRGGPDGGVRGRGGPGCYACAGDRKEEAR
jgi:hypothetical protein